MHYWSELESAICGIVFTSRLALRRRRVLKLNRRPVEEIMSSRKDKLKDEIDTMSHKAKKDLEKVIDKSKHPAKHKSEQDKDGGASI